MSPLHTSQTPRAASARVSPLVALQDEGNGPISFAVNLVPDGTGGYQIDIQYNSSSIAAHDDTLEYGLFTGNASVVATLPATTTFNGTGGYIVTASTGGVSWSVSGAILESPDMYPDAYPGNTYNFTVSITDPETSQVISTTSDPIIKVYRKRPG